MKNWRYRWRAGDWEALILLAIAIMLVLFWMRDTQGQTTVMDASQGLTWDDPMLTYNPDAVCFDDCGCANVLPDRYRVWWRLASNPEWTYGYVFGAQFDHTYPQKLLWFNEGTEVCFALQAGALGPVFSCIEEEVCVLWPLIWAVGEEPIPPA